MEEVKKTKSSTLPLSPDVINDLVSNKEKSPTPPKKIRYLPWIILGLSIFLVVGSGGLLLWKIINQPDLIINAPSVIFPSTTPSPTLSAQTTIVANEQLLFEDQPYRNDQYKFQINIPQGWEVDDTGTSKSAVVLTNPQPIMASGSALLTFINVSVGNPSSQNLADYVQQARDGLTSAFDSYSIEEDKDLVLQGVTYHLIGGSYQVKGNKMKNRNVLLVYNNRGYAISATTPEAAWSKVELLLNATIFSFKNF
jgi:hypothetical protein